MWRVVEEWAPGLLEAQIWGLELAQFGPHHFRTLYTHINQIMQIIIIIILARKSHGSCFCDISTHTITRKPVFGVCDQVRLKQAFSVSEAC